VVSPATLNHLQKNVWRTANVDGQRCDSLQKPHPALEGTLYRQTTKRDKSFHFPNLQAAIRNLQSTIDNSNPPHFQQQENRSIPPIREICGIRDFFRVNSCEFAVNNQRESAISVFVPSWQNFLKIFAFFPLTFRPLF